jgi:hypothetical protein
MQSVRFNCKTFLHLIVQPEEHHPGPLNDLIANDMSEHKSGTVSTQAVAALLPFVDQTAAANAGFDTSRVFEFHPFTPHIAESVGTSSTILLSLFALSSGKR